MGSLLSLVMLGITVYFLFFGFLFGFKRGLVRSIVRLITVGIAVAIAWLFKDALVTVAMNVEFGGESVHGMIDSLRLDMPAFASMFETLLALALGVILFVVAFLLLKLVTAVIFFFIGFFFPKGKRPAGMIVGILQGAVIAFFVCVPLNGLAVDLAKLADFDMGKGWDVSGIRSIGETAEEYADSGISKLYTSVGKGVYGALTSSKIASGKEITFSGYVDAAVSSGKLVDVVDTVSKIDMTDGLTEKNRDTIQQVLRDLDAIKNDMGEDAIVVVNEMLSAVASDFGAELPEGVKTLVEEMDLEEVSFEDEGDIIIMLYDFLTNEDSEYTAKDIIDVLSRSTIVLPMIESFLAEEEATLAIDDPALRAEIRAAIADVSDPEMRQRLGALFDL